MKTPPPFLITADRGHVIAWRHQDGRVPERLEAFDISEGLMSSDELASDNSMALPARGTGARGTDSEERLTLDNELETRALRKVAKYINELAAKSGGGSWGLAAPSEINRTLLEELDPEARRTLTVNLPLDLTGHRAEDVLEHFRRAGEKE